MRQSEPSIKEVLALAQTWQYRANALLSGAAKARHRRMARLLNRPVDRVVITKLLDQCFRSTSPRRTADQVHSLLIEYGVPGFFSSPEKVLMHLFLAVGRHFPGLTVPWVIRKMRRESRQSIMVENSALFQAYLQQRRGQGVRININHLGEAVLGEAQARARLETYLHDLKNPAVEYISVKLSTLFSQIHPLAFESTLDILQQRLARLYRHAARHRFVRLDGSRIPKFVNLDMESYRDLEITTAAFIRTLEQEEFKNCYAGMALQAYLPDSFNMLRQISAWARKRVAGGGSPVKIRIVKGANLEMEKVEAALRDWPLAPYDSKKDVDANYKRMVAYGMQPQNIRAVHLGIASHNLFELAYAYLLGRQNGVCDFFTFEMLEGMADHLRQAIQETGQQVVLYTPVVAEDQFTNAIAYLIRRLDENTGPDNFLRHIHQLRPGTRTWHLLAGHFRASAEGRDQPGQRPHRRQNRLTEKFPPAMDAFHQSEFKNEPDTDWSLAANRKWAAAIREKWRKGPGDKPLKIPLVVGGSEIFSHRRIKTGRDPSQFNAGVVIARFAMANTQDIQKAVVTARADPDGWRRKSFKTRHRILSRAAMEIRKSRADLIGAAAADTGKVFAEADREVSEAIDFTEFYPHAVKTFTDIATIRSRGQGVGVVISPWNFPIAIPCGGIAAALAAGNCVILKPASDSILPAWLLCRCFWRAGISKNTLQFLPCAGTATGHRLAVHPGVDFVIFTGGTATGRSILRQKPGIFLTAETGGKNATIVTALADRDQAISHVIDSAFGNSGQKCSATSLLILEREVYRDKGFKHRLVDAARSFRSGSAWNFASRMGPLIRPPQGELKKALTHLAPGESWALRPQNVDGNPLLWRPAIKWGVRPDSATYRHELFGPLLAVMEARDLNHAIALVNGTGYGLTSGLESLDRREQQHWQRAVKAGNLYINRSTTGAVTLRQPFGGLGKSALGAGIKAGGALYPGQFMEFEEIGPPIVGPLKSAHPLLGLVNRWARKLRWGEFAGFAEDLKKTIRAVKSYLYHVEQQFGRQIDHVHLRGQDNILRYLPVGLVAVRVHPDDSLFEILARIAAVQITGNSLRISIPPGLDNPATRFLLGDEGRRMTARAPIFYELDNDLAKSIPRVDRIRYAAAQRVAGSVLQAAALSGFYIARTKVFMEGRIELMQYYRQQSICHNYHRYGHLAERAAEFELA